MRQRISASTMVRGMGLAAKALEVLNSKIIEHGGMEESLTLLTRPRFSHNAEAVGKFIAALDWRIPASEMIKRARKSAKRDFGDDDPRLEEFTHLFWTQVCSDLGIPCEKFCQDPEHGDPAIPPSLLKCLHGKLMAYPMVFRFLQGDHVVVNWGTKDGRIIAPGEIIDSDNIDVLAITSAKYFDLHH